MKRLNTNPRSTATQNLKYFLKNPGYFSILLVGENGVGKEFLLNQIINQDKELKNKNFKKFFPFEIGETEEDMKSIFLEPKNGTKILIHSKKGLDTEKTTNGRYP